MAKIQEIKVNNFSGGVSDSPRENTGSKFIISKHFDIFTDPQKLTPYRNLAADTNDGSTPTGMKQYFVKDFVYSSTSSILYGLGQNASTNTKIVYKADATSGNWTLPASSEGNGAVWNGSFKEYKDYLLGFQGTNQIFKWGTLSGTPSITNSVSTVASTITSVADSVIASDGNLYMAYNNIVVRVNTSLTVTDAAKTISTNFKITSLANYGKYLAIGCSPVSTYNGTSKVFLWDQSSDLFAETIDWGEGELRILETIDGMLVGVTDRYLNNATGAGKGSMIIQTYTGGTPQVVKEIFTQALTGKSIPLSKTVKNNRVFWAAKIMTNAAGTEYHEGIWSFGRKNVAYPYALTLDVIDENINTSGIQAFGTAANYFFITHSGDGSIDKTSATSTYTFTSIYETQIYDAGDVSKTKQLLQFTIGTAPIPTGGAITVKYKVDADTSWTTIGTLSTVGEVARDFMAIEPTGDAFATHGEVKFRIESTGGAELTMYRLKTQDLIGSIDP